MRFAWITCSYMTPAIYKILSRHRSSSRVPSSASLSPPLGRPLKMSHSVGSLHASDQHLHTHDVLDLTEPQFAHEAFARHETQSGIRSLATLSVARTWRISSAAEPTAGGEGVLTLHVGQPVAQASLLISALPLRRKVGSDPSPDEHLEHTVHLRAPVVKGATKTLKYGPVCRAGAHVVAVTLNGAHVIGSPLHILVHPAAAEARMCELRPYGAKQQGGVARGGGAGAGKKAGGVQMQHGVATSDIVLGVQLRDRFGNKCATASAAEVAHDLAANLRVMVQRQHAPSDGMETPASLLGKPLNTDFDPRILEPRALQPALGSPAAEDRLSYTFAVAGDDGDHGNRRSSCRDGTGPHAATNSAAGSASGLLLVKLQIARAGLHLVTTSLHGEMLPSGIVVHVKPGPAKAAASTAHDVVEEERMALSRCVAGVPRQLRLVARDANGNATRLTDVHRWSVELRATNPSMADADTSEQRHNPLSFSAQLELDDAFSPGTALLTYRVESPGTHEMFLRLGGRVVRSSPTPLTVLVPAWGPHLSIGVAGETAMFYVRLRPEGSAVPGSAQGRRLMHSLSVEAVERASHEVATVSVRQVTAPLPAYAADGEEGPGEIAEVSVLAATASHLWSLAVRIDGLHILGSPFAWSVRPGSPSAERCLLHAPWVGDRRAAAGVRHVGELVLRDRTGNECAGGEALDVQVWLREEFVVEVPPGVHDTDEDPDAAAVRLLATPAKGGSKPDVLRGEAAARLGHEPPVEYADERRTFRQEVVHLGGGRYHVAWTATRAGEHSLLALVDGQLLRCSLRIEVHADGATAAATELFPPPNCRLLPQSWNILQLRCRDASGNHSELLDPTRLSVTCEGLASVSHVKLREKPGLDGAYEVLLFGEPVGMVTLHVMLDGRHVQNSPLEMEVAATSATAGRCYAFGPGLGSKGAVQLGTTTRFTIVACDVTGTRRRVGGDPFKVVISPRQSAHHVCSWPCPCTKALDARTLSPLALPPPLRVAHLVITWSHQLMSVRAACTTGQDPRWHERCLHRVVDTALQRWLPHPYHASRPPHLRHAVQGECCWRWAVQLQGSAVCRATWVVHRISRARRD